MTWRIEIGTGTNRVLLGEILTAQSAWKRLSKPAREAVKAAYPDGELRAHPNTVKALERHGFITMPAQHIPHGYQIEAFGFLTEAGKAVAKWNARDAKGVCTDCGSPPEAEHTAACRWYPPDGYPSPRMAKP